MSRYHYTGDRKKLKKEGYSFYGNFYSNDLLDIRTKSRKGEIYFTDVSAKHQAKFIDYILDNKEKDASFWLIDIPHKHPAFNLTDMPVLCMTRFGQIMKVDDFYEKSFKEKEERRELLAKTPKEDKRRVSIENFEEKEYIKDPMYFSKEIIASILVLDKLGLTLVSSEPKQSQEVKIESSIDMNDKDNTANSLKMN